MIKNIYLKCFGIPVYNKADDWVPHFSCNICYTASIRWNQGSLHALKFKEPMKWRQPKNHDDCYFCQIKIAGFKSK